MKKTKNITISQISLAVLAVALLVFGALNGEAGDVFTKAINICMECIGLG